MNHCFYSTLFNKNSSNGQVIDEIYQFVNDKDIHHQDSINEVLETLLEKRKFKEPQSVYSYQADISANGRHEYDRKKKVRDHFREDDVIFLLVAMLQVIWNFTFFNLLEPKKIERTFAMFKHSKLYLS